MFINWPLDLQARKNGAEIKNALAFVISLIGISYKVFNESVEYMDSKNNKSKFNKNLLNN